MQKNVVIIGAGVSGLCTGALLAEEGVRVRVFEKAQKIGGRTASMRFRGHVLDNGFHIMPFYKTSAVYRVLRRTGAAQRLGLAMVKDISFFSGESFFRYPRGIADILRLSLVPFRSRLRLLRILVPMAFSSMGRAETLDERPLTEITDGMDGDTRSFFDAVCMLAFADTPNHVSLGEFVRTMIRANPFRGGTSEFAYPEEGGYDRISDVLAGRIREGGGSVELNSPVKNIVIKDGKAAGIVTARGELVKADCVVVTYPAYIAVRQLFEEGTFEKAFLDKVRRLEKTTSVIETHFCTSEQIDKRQIVFPIGRYTAKGIFFITNITPRVSPPGEHLMMAGTPVPSRYAKDPAKVREISAEMRKEIACMYPGFERSLLWERPMAWGMVESVVKEPGMVWRKKMPHETGIGGLYFVGDSTVSYGIGTDSAAHSSLLCHPKIMRGLRPES